MQDGKGPEEFSSDVMGKRRRQRRSPEPARGRLFHAISRSLVHVPNLRIFNTAVKEENTSGSVSHFGNPTDELPDWLAFANGHTQGETMSIYLNGGYFYSVPAAVGARLGESLA